MTITNGRGFVSPVSKERLYDNEKVPKKPPKTHKS